MPREQFDEFPFNSHYADIGGLRYHYIDEGRRDVLLFVHGNPTWSFAWRRLVGELSQQYRCIAVDHIGCGLSDKPQNYRYRLDQHIINLTQFVERLDLRRITLIAHDWGGAIGMGTAGRLPDRFSRFVLMNTAAFRSSRIPLRIAVCRIPLLGALGVRGLNLFCRAALHMAVEKRVAPAVRRGYLAPYNNWNNRIAVLRFVQDIPLNANHPSYRILEDVERSLVQFKSCPMLLAWGMRDWCFSHGFLREFESRFTNAETFEIDDAGHFLFEDAHERLIVRVREFLEQHPLVV